MTHLYGCQNGRYVIRRTPTVLQYVQTDTSVGIYVGMKHFTDKSNSGWFIWVFFGELYGEFKRPIFERSVMWSAIVNSV